MNRYSINRKLFKIFTYIIIFLFHTCVQEEGLQVIPGEFCLEKRPRITNYSRFQVVNSQLIFLAGEAKTSYFKNKDSLSDYTYLARSSDGGKTWTILEPPTSDDLARSNLDKIQLTADFINSEKGIVYTNVEGNLAFYTVNSGINYERIPHDLNENVRAVFISEDTLILYGNSKDLTQSDSPGYPFLRSYNINSKTLSDIQLPNLTSYAPGSVIIASLHNNEIFIKYAENFSANSLNSQVFFRSQDLGNSFQEIVPFEERKGNIVFYKSNLAYRLYQNEFARSDDFGLTWTLLGTYSSTYPSNSRLPFFLSDNFLYLRDYSDDRNKYYVSDLYGTNWERLIFNPSSVFFFSESQFDRENDRFYSFGRGKDIVSYDYPFKEARVVGVNPIYTHVYDDRTDKNRLEWMALGFFCAIF